MRKSKQDNHNKWPFSDTVTVANMKRTISYPGFFTLNFQPAWLGARSESNLSICLIAHNSVARCEVFVSVSTFELKVERVSPSAGILPIVPFHWNE